MEANEPGTLPTTESPAEQLAEAVSPKREETSPDSAPKATLEKKSARLASLDAFRGLTILGMLLVNNVALGEFTPRHLTHAPWNQGVYFADMVFPWFLFIVGVAIPYSAASFKRKNSSLFSYFGKGLNRAVMLVVLGCLIDSSINKRPLFDLGVLQLIGLAYLCATLLYEIPRKLGYFAVPLLLVAHWALIRFVAAPGMPAGIFEESKNIIQVINAKYLSPFNLQGLVSVAPTTALALLGCMVGDLLRAKRLSDFAKFGWLFATGAVLAFDGWVWSLSLPMNKPVWTSSYIVFSAGLGAMILAVFYIIMDVLKFRAWAFPFVVFGMNAIVAYVAPILVKLYVFQVWTIPVGAGRMPIQQGLLAMAVSAHGQIVGGWVYTIGYALFWWLVVFYLYRNKVFVRV